VPLEAAPLLDVDGTLIGLHSGTVRFHTCALCPNRVKPEGGLRPAPRRKRLS